jgi:hypothetical protein
MARRVHRPVLCPLVPLDGVARIGCRFFGGRFSLSSSSSSASLSSCPYSSRARWKESTMIREFRAGASPGHRGTESEKSRRHAGYYKEEAASLWAAKSGKRLRLCPALLHHTRRGADTVANICKMRLRWRLRLSLRLPLFPAGRPARPSTKQDATTTGEMHFTPMRRIGPPMRRLAASSPSEP